MVLMMFMQCQPRHIGFEASEPSSIPALHLLTDRDMIFARNINDSSPRAVTRTTQELDLNISILYL